MKWKDSGELVNKEEHAKEEEFFDEEQYSPWADRKDNRKGRVFNKIPLLLVLLVAAIVALVVALLMLVMNGSSGDVSSQQLTALSERLQKLEERLDKYEAIDEKVTRIWEQAKSFEKFKDRFDRSEASTSLRMDHLTMSLETLQKQLNETQAPITVQTPPKQADAKKAENKIQYHQVQAGETLYSISKKYNLKVDQLLKMNQMKPGSVIQPGQRLVVNRPTQ
jgi:LysM repeat protein